MPSNQLSMLYTGWCGGNCHGLACTACLKAERARENERQRMEDEFDALYSREPDPDDLIWV